jgi:hypothetical protein
MKELIRFIINNLEDRNALVRVLTSAGYAVRIIKTEHLLDCTYVVIIYE